MSRTFLFIFPLLFADFFSPSYFFISLLCSPPNLPHSLFLPEEVDTAASHRLYPGCATDTFTSSSPLHSFVLLPFRSFTLSLSLIRHFTSSLTSLLPFTLPDPPTSLFKDRRVTLFSPSYLKSVVKATAAGLAVWFQNVSSVSDLTFLLSTVW